MSLQTQQVAADDVDVKQTDTGTSPSGASVSVIVRGFAPDMGGTYADFNATSTIVRYP